MKRFTKDLGPTVTPYRYVVNTENDKDPLQKGMQAVQKLAEYENLEEKHALIQIPCSIGTTVYIKSASYATKPYYMGTVINFSHSISSGFCIVVQSIGTDLLHIPFSEFGKSIFLTSTDAEKAIYKEGDE